jgi:two-component system cell cycle sensor histidine kinase/response regulator CckA
MLRVLLVDDSDEDAFLLLNEIKQGGFEVESLRVQTAEHMRAALAEREWDLVLSDYSMPRFSGIDALRVLQETGRDIPFIMASGTIGEETAIETLKAGACDFILKERLTRLVPAIKRELREAEQRRARRAAEAALSNVQARMQFVLETAGVGIWEINLAEQTVVWSDVQERLHGLRAGEFKGTLEAFLDCVHPDDRAAVLSGLRETQPSGSVLLEYRTRWPDGSVHWIRAVGRTVAADDQQRLRVLGVATDATEQRSIEEQLRRAQKLEAVGGLAAGVAHDFNNLLTVISGYSGLLADRFADDPEVTADLTEIERAVKSAVSLTRQLLAFGRQQVARPKVDDLNRVLTDNYAMLRRLVEENVRIDLELADRLEPLKIDPGQIEQVLLNLVVNARDAMPDGGVITIKTENVVLDGSFSSSHRDVPDGEYVLWSISDTGTGMPPEVQARMFDPFFTTKAPGHGTGLGLATVYGIVKQAGGHLSVQSEVGRGTTFRIYLPLARAVPSASAASTGEPATLHGTETVLVVEDEDRLRELARRILQPNGYNVLLAANGDEAVKIAADYQGPIHIVITDIVMPGMGGRDVVAWMATHRPEAKAIYLSGYSRGGPGQQDLPDPAARFVDKPFTAATLLRTIRQALDE